MFFRFLVCVFVYVCAYAALSIPAFVWAQGGQSLGNGLSLRTSFAPALKEVAPAVVNIFTEKRVRQRAVHPFASDPFFEQFFGRAFGAPLRERVQRSLGSGVVATADGYVISNAHVVNGAEAIRVQFHDGRERSAALISADEKLDIAVLKLDLEAGERLSYVPFGDSDTLQVGDVVLAVGNPFGVGQSVTMGIVSALGRSNLGTGLYENFIQTDAAINPGNSGGALVDSNGHLVGVNTAIFTKSGGSQGVGFATPSNTVNAILKSVLTTGKISRPWFGASGQDLNADLAEKLSLAKPQGVLVNDVVPASPAQRAGITLGDVILTLDGVHISSAHDLEARLATLSYDARVDIGVWREGRLRTVSLQLEPLPERRVEDRLTLSGSHPLDGYTVERLSPALNQELGLALSASGVAIVDVPRREASFFGATFQPGDIILAINGRELSTLDDLRSILSKRARRWEIAYQRGKAVYKILIQ